MTTALVKWLVLLVVFVPYVVRAGESMVNGQRSLDKGRSILIDGVAAHVNEHVITISDVMAVLQPVQRRLSNTYEGNELQARLRKAYEGALNVLIEQYLILDAHEKQELKTPEWIIDQRINGVIHEMFEGDRAEFTTALSREGLTFDEWQSKMRDQIIVSFMHRLKIEQNVRVSPKAVRSAYDENLEQYRAPEKVRLRMIVIREKGGLAEDEALKRQQAEDIRKRLVAGENFAELARAFSQGSKAQDGGNWGWVEPKMLRPELACLASELNAGEISEVIDTKDELYIIKIEERKSELLTPFEEAQPQIERELRLKKTERLYTAWIDRLRKDAYVKVLAVDLF